MTFRRTHTFTLLRRHFPTTRAYRKALVAALRDPRARKARDIIELISPPGTPTHKQKWQRVGIVIDVGRHDRRDAAARLLSSRRHSGHA